MPDKVRIFIDGRPFEAAPTDTIFEAAKDNGIDIPTVCHMPPQTPVGVCRVCIVEATYPAANPQQKPQTKFVPACAQGVAPEMQVQTASASVVIARRTLVELLMADHPTPCAREKDTHDCELEQRAREFGAMPRYAKALHEKAPFAGWSEDDDSHPNILVDHAACIVCDRCVRGCTEQAKNFVIGRAGKGNATVVTFDDGHAMGQSSCVSCGECMVSCPTGALTNRGFKSVGLEGTAVTAKELLRMPSPNRDEIGRPISLFDGISEKYLTKVLGDVGIGKNENAVVRRRIPKDTTICTIGEEGSTAFFIESGRVAISVPRPRKVESVGFFGRLLRGTRTKVTVDTSVDRPIPVDASIDLDPNDPVATRGPGELFGEMSCLNYYPRSATVTALEDTIVIEMLRPVLLLLKRSKSFGAYLQDLYCRRSLEALPSFPLLKNVPRSFLEELRTKLTLRQYEPGTVIFHEGDTADAFFLVQVGFVKVGRKLADGELLVEYRGRHEFFGEIALLEKDASKRTRTATCTAADHVDLVRIENDDFQMLLDRFPDIRETVERAAAERRRTYENNPLARSRAFGKEEQVRQNLMEAQSLLLLDLDRCTRCDLCVKACEEAHDGTTRLVREGVRYDHYREGVGYEHYLVATSCRQCHDPLCMPGCPVGSIRRDKDLQIRIESWCIGCGVCAEKCPYGNINMHELRDVEPVDTRKAVAVPRYRAAACDLCHDVAHDPSCVIACPHGAAIRVEDPKSFFDNPVPQGTPARAPWR